VGTGKRLAAAAGDKGEGGSGGEGEWTGPAVGVRCAVVPARLVSTEGRDVPPVAVPLGSQQKRPQGPGTKNRGVAPPCPLQPRRPQPPLLAARDAPGTRALREDSTRHTTPHGGKTHQQHNHPAIPSSPHPPRSQRRTGRCSSRQEGGEGPEGERSRKVEFALLVCGARCAGATRLRRGGEVCHPLDAPVASASGGHGGTTERIAGFPRPRSRTLHSPIAGRPSARLERERYERTRLGTTQHNGKTHQQHNHPAATSSPAPDRGRSHPSALIRRTACRPQ